MKWATATSGFDEVFDAAGLPRPHYAPLISILESFAFRCGNQRFVHGHHVKHWLQGGRTSLDNLLLLCSFHHRLVHEGGFTVALTDGVNVEVRGPSGSLLAASPPLAPDSGAVDWCGDWWTAGDHFAPPFPSGHGDPVDYHEAIASLVA